MATLMFNRFAAAGCCCAGGLSGGHSCRRPNSWRASEQHCSCAGNGYAGGGETLIQTEGAYPDAGSESPGGNLSVTSRDDEAEEFVVSRREKRRLTRQATKDLLQDGWA